MLLVVCFRKHCLTLLSKHPIPYKNCTNTCHDHNFYATISLSDWWILWFYKYFILNCILHCQDPTVVFCWHCKWLLVKVQVLEVTGQCCWSWGFLLLSVYYCCSNVHFWLMDLFLRRHLEDVCVQRTHPSWFCFSLPLVSLLSLSQSFLFN